MAPAPRPGADGPSWAPGRLAVGGNAPSAVPVSRRDGESTTQPGRKTGEKGRWKDGREGILKRRKTKIKEK